MIPSSWQLTMPWRPQLSLFISIPQHQTLFISSFDLIVRGESYFMKAFRNYLMVASLLLGAMFIYIPVRYQTPYPRAIGPQFDSYIRHLFQNKLDEEQPEVLLFGDSMLAPAVNEATVAKQLGKKTMLSSRSGTAFTIWYAIIKNDILHAKHKPRYLVIFFRDSMMTVPGYKVNGRYLEQVDEFAAPDDTLLI